MDTVEAALEWVGDGGAPFFLWVHLFEPHAPYAPALPLGTPTEVRYDADVARADRIVGTLLDGLDAVRQHAAQPEGVALLLAEGEVLGEESGTEQLEAAKVDLSGAPGDDGREWLLEWLHPDLR